MSQLIICAAPFSQFSDLLENTSYSCSMKCLIPLTCSSNEPVCQGVIIVLIRSPTSTPHLEYFYFVGRIFALALRYSIPLRAKFISSFYKMILGFSVALEDMESIDQQYYRSLVWILYHHLMNLD